MSLLVNPSPLLGGAYGGHRSICQGGLLRPHYLDFLPPRSRVGVIGHLLCLLPLVYIRVGYCTGQFQGYIPLCVV
jgi:hypothetical protein